MKADILLAGIQGVTREWTKQRKAEEREASARFRRAAMWRPRRVTVVEACGHYMEEAYLLASGNGTYPATARQVMYAIRRQVQQATGRRLDDQYFTQQILPDYIAARGLSWEVVYDDRGHFQEPHEGGRVIGLGTLGVRRYLQGAKSLGIDDLHAVPRMIAPRGPGYRYAAILFIEKEGFLPLLEQAGFAARYDLAIMSTKGVSNTSARRLIDAIWGESQVPVLVLHDFDRAGLVILSTLQQDTRRYSFASKGIRVVDLGLRLEDVEQYNLQDEQVFERIKPHKLREQLRRNSATPEEEDFLASGRRVELNAFTSDQFVEWLKGKLDQLQEQGVIGKVVPDQATLGRVYRAVVARAYFEQHIGGLADHAWKEADSAGVPDALEGRVRELLEDTPSMPWDSAIEEIVSHDRG